MNIKDKGFVSNVSIYPIASTMYQPYKELCVESIVKHCGDSFQICLIDDSSFGKILNDWTICMDGLAEPIKDRVRTLALSKILYTYGGMLVPNSTIAMKDLKEKIVLGIQDLEATIKVCQNKSPYL